MAPSSVLTVSCSHVHGGITTESKTGHRGGLAGSSLSHPGSDTCRGSGCR